MAFVNVLAVLYFSVLLSLSRSDDPSAIGGIGASQQQQQQLSRQKRTLVYTPTSSILLLILGLGTPLQLERESVIVGAFTKAIYTLPNNASIYTEPGVHYGREGDIRKINSTRSRWSLYKTVSQLAELYGFGDGRSCLLRAICELASSPFDVRQGLLQQLFQTFFAPSSTKEMYDEYSDREYHAAEKLGRDERHVDAERCHALYPDCRRSFLDVFSAVRRYLVPPLH
ncbi:uncharacterized protein LOC116415748 [Nasonia vitripennis]|uniref:Uncharacterized protein n=1 Tax=Nasonia vitripennis TaxID=7425 RepID=A0A7M7PYT5_NASVI|nr:uncharacterized protein LOC116415748 [Nasonia vitripennis]